MERFGARHRAQAVPCVLQFEVALERCTDPAAVGFVPHSKRLVNADKDTFKRNADREGGTVTVTAANPIRGVCPGQAAVFYDLQNNECLGGGFIVGTGPTELEVAVADGTTGSVADGNASLRYSN